MIRPLVGDIAYTFLFAVLLFGPAGSFAWPRAWVLLAALACVRFTITAVVSRVHRSLLIERSRLPLHSEQPLADRIVLIAFMASFAAQVAFTAADVFHWRLAGAPPNWLSALGLPIFVAGWIGVGFALRANAFAVTVVRLQNEREQRVISTGPYRVVRHPMYASLLLVFIGLPLWLGSVAGALAGAVPAALLVVRIRMEERFLLRCLEGYAAYARQTRWRLAPYVW